MKVVSKALRNSARGRNCTLRLPGCNHNPETTVLAHLPCGYGIMGGKGNDNVSCYTCDHCHGVIDGRIKGEMPTWKDISRAIAETQHQWIEEGLMTIKGVA